MRNDASLYTGASSATSSEELVRKKEAKKAKKIEEKAQLKPVEALVFDLLDSEMLSAKGSLVTTIEEEKDIETLKLKVLAHKEYINTISRLKAKLKTILRAK